MLASQQRKEDQEGGVRESKCQNDVKLVRTNHLLVNSLVESSMRSTQTSGGGTVNTECRNGKHKGK